MSSILLLQRTHPLLLWFCILLLLLHGGCRFHRNDVVNAFTISPISSSVSILCTTTTRSNSNTLIIKQNGIQTKKQHFGLVALSSSSNDDDWYSDFNPTEFVAKPRSTSWSSDDKSDNNGYSNNNKRRGSSGYERRVGSGGGNNSNNYRGRSNDNNGNRRSSNNNNNVRYERDTSRDNSNVDVATIETLLQDRVDARRDGNYDLADTIRQTLIEDYGVQVWDKDRIWRSGCSTGGSGRKRFDDRNGDRNNGREQRRGRKDVTTIDFGPNGHDYDVAPGAGPIISSFDEDEIHDRIATRLRSKLSRQFEIADQIQAELAAAGVYIHDGKKQWRADGEFFGDNDTRSGSSSNNGQPGRERGSRSSKALSYTQSASSDPDVVLSNDDVTEIESLIRKRTQAKASRDYNAADNIRDTLRTTFNVYVDDRLMEWSVNGNFGRTAKNDDTRFQAWSESEFSEGSSDDTSNDAIIDLLEQRDVARASRNFQNADVLRDQLLDEYNVVINDRLREWSVGGNFGLPEKRNKNDKDRPFVRRNTNRGNLSPTDIQTIEELVHERDIAKKNRDFTSADDIREQLEIDYSVKVDDKTREWMVLTDEYSLAPTSRGGQTLDEETLSYIANRLKERSAYKAERNYDEADAIRDELNEQYSVSIDDRNREFSITVDEFSIIDRDNNSRRTNNRRQVSSNEYEYDADKTNDNNNNNISDDDIDDFEVPLLERDDDSRVFRSGSSRKSSSSSSSSMKQYETDDPKSVFDVVVEGELMKPNYFKTLTVVQLKEKLREAGLPVSGNKAELVDRLISNGIKNEYSP